MAGSVVVTALTALSVGVVNVADLSVWLGADTAAAVIPVVAREVLDVVCDSVVDIVGLVVASLNADRHAFPVLSYFILINQVPSF